MHIKIIELIYVLCHTLFLSFYCIISVVNLNETEFEKFNNDYNLVIPMDMKVPADKEVDVAKEIKKFYFDGKPLSLQNINQYIEVRNLLTYLGQLG